MRRPPRTPSSSTCSAAANAANWGAKGTVAAVFGTAAAVFGP